MTARVAALTHPMSKRMLSRIERLQRRRDVDDLLVIAEPLHVSPLVLLQRPSDL
ncbi:XRE family transcriptional regulator [Streptomyces tsukubensis]|uniref:XRE family transcriptional regulator n=1 Tax=Streptomyces tsukubensis TaxID=83656 RepID=UPI00344E86FC